MEWERVVKSMLQGLGLVAGINKKGWIAQSCSKSVFRRRLGLGLGLGLVGFQPVGSDADFDLDGAVEFEGTDHAVGGQLPELGFLVGV